MIKSFFLILTFVGLNSGSLVNNAEDTDWQISKSKKLILLYTRKVSYSDYKEFKGEMIVASNPEAIVKYLRNIDDYKDWLPDCLESKKLDAISASEQINYVLTDIPWPYEDRDLAYKFTLVPEDSITGQIIILIENRPDYIPFRKKIVRIPKSVGFWTLTPIGENKTKAEYQMHVEPGGYVPAWLANLKLVDTPFLFMYNLREQVEKE
jgi:hypothetical protein